MHSIKGKVFGISCSLLRLTSYLQLACVAKRSTVGPWPTGCRPVPYRLNRTGASHLHDLPFEHGMKSLWRLVVCCRDRELADLKYQKKLNLCEWHIPEAL